MASNVYTSHSFIVFIYLLPIISNWIPCKTSPSQEQALRLWQNKTNSNWLEKSYAKGMWWWKWWGLLLYWWWFGVWRWQLRRMLWFWWALLWRIWSWRRWFESFWWRIWNGHCLFGSDCICHSFRRNWSWFCYFLCSLF